jgi:ABC-type transporter Mla maintaining outer membrane lipid asymmetry permease subunit MlaE
MVEPENDLVDPVGEEYERESLRNLGKWRFTIIRGVSGIGAPMFLWFAITSFREDLRQAQALGQNVLWYLLQSWAFMFCITAFFGCIVGFLGWRRLTSDYWPGREPDPESEQTRLGSLR